MLIVKEVLCLIKIKSLLIAEKIRPFIKLCIIYDEFTAFLFYPHSPSHLTIILQTSHLHLQRVHPTTALLHTLTLKPHLLATTQGTRVYYKNRTVWHHIDFGDVLHLHRVLTTFHA